MKLWKKSLFQYSLILSDSMHKKNHLKWIYIFTSIILAWRMISCRSVHLTHSCLFLLHFYPHFSPRTSPFSRSLLPSCPRLIHLMAVCLTLASFMEQINRSWKRPSNNLLMISSFSWTHKCLPSGRLPPFGGHYFSCVNKVTISSTLILLKIGENEALQYCLC